jgi:O-6-methylguanine DNA methyltransferase
MNMIPKKDLIELPVPTGEGVFLARYSQNGLAALDFPGPNGSQPAKPGTRNAEGRQGPAGKAQKKARAQLVLGRVLDKVYGWHRTTTKALQTVLAGRAASALPPLDWTGTTEFQQAVWREMLKLGPGQTRSYGEIAGAIGKPRAVRAVGGACGANPVPVLVPCHRILAANQKIGGFSGGLEWKRSLLAREGVKHG